MADDGAEVEKREIVLGLRKKPDKPSKISKSKPKAAEVEKEKRVIVLALRKEPDLPTKISKPKPKLAKRKLEKQGNVKKKNKKRYLNDKDDGGEGSDDLPEDVEGAVMNHGDKPRRSVRTIKPNPKYAQ